MTSEYRIVVCVDVPAENAQTAYEKIHASMMATGLPWESTDEWFDTDGNTIPLVDVEHAREQAYLRRTFSDYTDASELRSRIYQRRLKEDAQLDTLLKGFKLLFDTAPLVRAVRWKQYTPYRNGCDPCEFLVYDPEYQIDGLEGWHEYYGWRTELTAEERRASAALLPIIPVELFSFAYREAFQSVFGDHVTVTVHRDLRVAIEDCDHE